MPDTKTMINNLNTEDIGYVMSHSPLSSSTHNDLQDRGFDSERGYSSTGDSTYAESIGNAGNGATETRPTPEPFLEDQLYIQQINGIDNGSTATLNQLGEQDFYVVNENIEDFTENKIKINDETPEAEQINNQPYNVKINFNNSNVVTNANNYDDTQIKQNNIAENNNENHAHKENIKQKSFETLENIETVKHEELQVYKQKDSIFEKSDTDVYSSNTSDNNKHEYIKDEVYISDNHTNENQIQKSINDQVSKKSNTPDHLVPKEKFDNDLVHSKVENKFEDNKNTNIISDEHDQNPKYENDISYLHETNIPKEKLTLINLNNSLDDIISNNNTLNEKEENELIDSKNNNFFKEQTIETEIPQLESHNEHILFEKPNLEQSIYLLNENNKFLNESDVSESYNVCETTKSDNSFAKVYTDNESNNNQRSKRGIIDENVNYNDQFNIEKRNSLSESVHSIKSQTNQESTQPENDEPKIYSNENEHISENNQNFNNNRDSNTSEENYTSLTNKNEKEIQLNLTTSIYDSQENNKEIESDTHNKLLENNTNDTETHKYNYQNSVEPNNDVNISFEQEDNNNIESNNDNHMSQSYYNELHNDNYLNKVYNDNNKPNDDIYSTLSENENEKYSKEDNNIDSHIDETITNYITDYYNNNNYDHKVNENALTTSKSIKNNIEYEKNNEILQHNLDNYNENKNIEHLDNINDQFTSNNNDVIESHDFENKLENENLVNENTDNKFKEQKQSELKSENVKKVDILGANATQNNSTQDLTNLKTSNSDTESCNDDILNQEQERNNMYSNFDEKNHTEEYVSNYLNSLTDNEIENSANYISSIITPHNSEYDFEKTLNQDDINHDIIEKVQNELSTVEQNKKFNSQSNEVTYDHKNNYDDVYHDSEKHDSKSITNNDNVENETAENVETIQTPQSKEINASEEFDFYPSVPSHQLLENNYNFNENNFENVKIKVQENENNIINEESIPHGDFEYKDYNTDVDHTNSIKSFNSNENLSLKKTINSVSNNDDNNNYYSHEKQYSNHELNEDELIDKDNFQDSKQFENLNNHNVFENVNDESVNNQNAYDLHKNSKSSAIKDATNCPESHENLSFRDESSSENVNEATYSESYTEEPSKSYAKTNNFNFSGHFLAQPSIEITPASDYGGSYEDHLERIKETKSSDPPLSPTSFEDYSSENQFEVFFNFKILLLKIYFVQILGIIL